MFGNNDGQNNQLQQDQGAVAPPDPTNDFGTMPPIENTPFGAPSMPASTPVDVTSTDDTAPSTPPTPDSTPAPDSSASGDLLSIKQDALTQLTPLVGHLEQTPEEKFRTTMMMIQAADDQSLVKVAFDAAKEISDDKARAQALLDVINEINYFTQHHQS